MFNIGERVIVKEYEDIPEAMKTKGISRIAGKVGVVVDKMQSEAKGATVYKLHLDGYKVPSRVEFLEESFDLVPEEEEPTYEYEFEFAENLVVARMYEVDGDHKKLIARGHGHIFHEGVLGIAQAASYALKRIYREVEGDCQFHEKLKGDKKISTLGMKHEEWLEYRRKSIGGSDAASIIGLNPWSSPYTVWADKLGKLPPKEDNEAMRQGRDLEFYVAERFCEATGKKVRRDNNIIINPEYPFAHANVDRVVVGEDAGLECKTTSVLNLKKFKNGAFPDTYYVQCVHYMMVTGCKKWYLAVLVLNKGFMVYEIERDEEEIAALAKSEAEFWRLVESKQPPVVDGSDSTSNTLSVLFPEATNCDKVDLFAYESDLDQYMALAAKIKELENIKDEMSNKVKAFLGESAGGETAKYRVSWASTTRNTFDSKKFAWAHKDIDLSPYYKTSTYRTFKVTEKN